MESPRTLLLFQVAGRCAKASEDFLNKVCLTHGSEAVQNAHSEALQV